MSGHTPHFMYRAQQLGSRNKLSIRLFLSILALSQVLLAGCGAPPVPPGLVVLDVESGQRRVLPLKGYPVGFYAKTGELFLVRGSGVSSYVLADSPQLVRNQSLRPQTETAYSEPEALSPDARRIAYLAYDYDETVNPPELIRGLWVADTSGATPSRQFLPYPDNEFSLVCLRWISDTTMCCALAGYSGSGPYAHSVLRINVDTGETKVLYKGRDFDMSQFALSPDRTRLAFFDDSPDFQKSTLNLLDVTTGTLTTLDSTLRRTDALAWSPDGARLAFLASHSLNVMNLADRKTRRIGSGSFSKLFYVANNRLIAVRYPEGRATQVHVFDTDRAKRLYMFRENTFYWLLALPDGRSLVYGTG